MDFGKHHIGYIVSFCILTFSQFVNAEKANVKLVGEIYEVDSLLSSQFTIGEKVEFSWVVDSSTSFDIFGASEAVDGTKFPSDVNEKFPTIAFGNGYVAKGPNAGDNYFFDLYSQAGTTFQGVNAGANNFVGDDVNGLVLSEVFIQSFFNELPFSGINNPIDIIPIGELYNLNEASFLPIQAVSGSGALISFVSETGGPYYYVKFKLNSVSVSEIVNWQYHDHESSELLGNGDEYLVTLRSNSEGQSSVIARSALTNSYFDSTTFFSSAYDPLGLSIVRDVDGNGVREVAVVGRNFNNGRVKIVVKDLVTNDVISSFDVLTSDDQPLSISTVEDINGNGADEIAVLAIRDGDQITRMQIRDSATGAYVSSLKHPK